MSSFKSRNFYVKHITEINVQNTNLQNKISNRKYSDETSMTLVSHTPCINGFINTSNLFEEFREERDKRKNKELSVLYMSKNRDEGKDV